MRSIGKVKIKKLKAMVRAEAESFRPLSMNAYQLAEAVKAKVPEDWFDTWESAWSEIDRIIGDETSAIMYGPDSGRDR